jgi:hypothetical protein
MKYLTKFYPFGVNYHGYFIQREKCEKEEILSKKELFAMADLRHAVLSKKEFLEVLMTDRFGKPKPEFELLTNTHLFICNPIK